MSDDFRYDSAAQGLDDTLEEIMETHKQEQEEVQKQSASVPQEFSALERIARGGAIDQVNLIVEQTRKLASDVLAEHHVRSMLREGAQARQALVDTFLENVGE